MRARCQVPSAASALLAESPATFTSRVSTVTSTPPHRDQSSEAMAAAPYSLAADGHVRVGSAEGSDLPWLAHGAPPPILTSYFVT